MAGWKEHYSLYPVNGRLAEELKERLESYEMGKGTLRLPFSKPVPEKLITRIAELLARGSGARKRTVPCVAIADVARAVAEGAFSANTVSRQESRRRRASRPHVSAEGGASRQGGVRAPLGPSHRKAYAR
jgi:hypothetical protein